MSGKYARLNMSLCKRAFCTYFATCNSSFTYSLDNSVFSVSSDQGVVFYVFMDTFVVTLKLVRVGYNVTSLFIL